MITLFLQSLFFFFFNDTATTEIYTLSLHDALPISAHARGGALEEQLGALGGVDLVVERLGARGLLDRKSTRLNSSHSQISYAVFCLKKKKKKLNNMLGMKHLDLIYDNTTHYIVSRL